MKTATTVTAKTEANTIISIHAVMKTATFDMRKLISTVDNFNPCSHEDCNGYEPDLRRDNENFNPCSHEDCNNDVMYSTFDSYRISIHAVMKTATFKLTNKVTVKGISIHAVMKTATCLTS